MLERSQCAGYIGHLLISPGQSLACRHALLYIRLRMRCRLIQRKTLLLVGQVICAVSAASFSFVIFLDTPVSFLCVCLVLRVVNGVGSAAVDTSFAIISR